MPGERTPPPRRRATASANLVYGEGSIYPRDGKFQARWNDEDGRPRAKTFQTPEEAEDHLRSIYRLKRAHRYIPPSDLTVTEMVKHHMERGRSHYDSGTYSAYAQCVKHRIDPLLGSTKVVDLDTPRLQHWIDRLGRMDYAPSTVQLTCAILKNAIDEAVRLKVMTFNPLLSVKRPRIRRSEHTTWTDAETRTFLNHVTDMPMWNAMYRLALFVGMRPGEVCSLAWKNINLADGTVLVTRSITKDFDGFEIVGTETKGREDRRVAIPPSAVQALTVWRTEQKKIRLQTVGWIEQGFVFTGKQGKYLSASTWARNQDRFSAEAGVPRLTLHELRHTNATTDMAAGVNPKVISERLGHKQTQTTLDLYQHARADIQRAAVDALEQRISLAETSEVEEIPAQSPAQTLSIKNSKHG